MESQDLKLIADGRAWKVDGKAQALVGPGLGTPLGGRIRTLLANPVTYTPTC